MKIYSYIRFACGLAWAIIGAQRLYQGVTRRSGGEIAAGILLGIVALVFFCLSTDEDLADRDREQMRKVRLTAGKRFGKWAWPVRWLGLLLMLGSFLVLAAGRSPAGFLALFLVGAAYTVIIETALRRWAKKDGI